MLESLEIEGLTLDKAKPSKACPGYPKSLCTFWEKGGAAVDADDFLHKKSEQIKLAPTW